MSEFEEDPELCAIAWQAEKYRKYKQHLKQCCFSPIKLEVQRTEDLLDWIKKVKTLYENTEDNSKWTVLRQFFGMDTEKLISLLYRLDEGIKKALNKSWKP